MDSTTYVPGPGDRLSFWVDSYGIARWALLSHTPNVRTSTVHDYRTRKPLTYCIGVDEPVLGGTMADGVYVVHS